jgi:hypothetical protein
MDGSRKVTMDCHAPDYPDDHGMDLARRDYARGVIHGALIAVGAIALIVWAATALG